MVLLKVSNHHKGENHMNEKALNIYHSTFFVELTKKDAIEKTYGFVINEGTDRSPRLIHYIKGNVTTKDISRVRMIFNYFHEEHFMERSVSGGFIAQKFTYDSKNDVSIAELPINVAGEKINVWL